MGDSLLKRIDTYVRNVFAAKPGAWLVWCDPQREWKQLLERGAGPRPAGFPLLVIDEQTASHFGSPAARAKLQAMIETEESFVLWVPVTAQHLDWLWGQALLAERIYERSLRSQLVEWGWRPPALTTSDAEVQALALRNWRQDPAAWGGDALQPDIDVLLPVLAGFREPDDENRFVLDVTIEAAGLPRPDGGDLTGWRTRSLALLLVTQAHHVAPECISSDHELLIAAAQRSFALRLLDRWADSQHFAVNLPEAIEQADRMAQLGGLVTGVALDTPPFLSRAAEQAVFMAACNRLTQLNGRSLLEATAALRPALERHDRGLWGHYTAANEALRIPWGEFLRLSHAAQELVAAAPADYWTTPQAAVDWYTKGGWRMDRAGAQINRELVMPSADLLRIIPALRAAYRARWEESLLRWSELWTGAGCPILSTLPSSGTWLKQALSGQQPATAILVLDALRYELGATLAERVDRQEGIQRSSVQPARAPLPSITALGMGMALPIVEEKLRADIVNGKWQLAAEGDTENLSVAEDRRSWWKANLTHLRLATLAEILADQFPRPDASCKHLVIHDATLDTMGHDDQLEAQGSEQTLKRYLAAVEHLRTHGWLRILIVTDHGYIHWPVNEEKGCSPPAPDPAYSSRRALAYPAATQLPMPAVLAPGGKWRIALPRGAASFRAYGGLGYFHGGASLQEWIIPCVTIQWPQRARPVTVTLQAVDNILSQQPKITLTVDANSTLREESIARQVEVLIRHQQTQSILFRSEPRWVTIDEPQVEIMLHKQEGVSAPRNTPVSIVVRDPTNEEQIDMQAATLKIELTDW